jgi:hypothetical protein
MALSLETGILSDLKSEDVEGYNYFKDQFDKLYEVLKTHEIKSDFKEPEDLDQEEVWSCQMYGYSGLHYLRILAAHIWDEKKVIKPGNEESDEDEAVEKYSEYFLKEESSIDVLFSKIGINRNKRKLKFDHLLIHSDAEGFYIPVDFDEVIFNDEIAGGMVGSTFKLKAELEVLAEWLELDFTLDIDSEEFWLLPEQQNKNKNKEKWKNFGIESHSCMNLLRACEESIKNKCAITFC